MVLDRQRILHDTGYGLYMCDVVQNYFAQADHTLRSYEGAYSIISLHADVAVVYKFIHIASSRFCVRLHVTSCWLVLFILDVYLYQTGK